MRAKEFIVEYDEGNRTEDFQGLKMRIKEDDYELIVSALDGDWGSKELAYVVMNKGDGNELDPQDLVVFEKYRGQGIAKAMYDYIKSKGYKIIKSHDVTRIKDQGTQSGEHFWQKNRGEETVWEDGYSAKDFTFDTEPYEGWNGEGLIVKAFDGRDEVGHVIFEPTEDDDTQWYAIDVEVEEPYQRRGIATYMYDIAKKAARAQGKIIVRSHAQSDAGRGLWKDKRVWEE